MSAKDGKGVLWCQKLFKMENGALLLKNFDKEMHLKQPV